MQITVQSWRVITRTDAEAKAPILCPPNAKNWLIEKEPDTGKEWRQEEKGMTEDEMVGWHPRLNGHEFEQAPVVGEWQGSLLCCSPWGHRVSDWGTEPNWWCGPQPYLTQRNHEPCRGGPPKMDRSWWRVLTKRPLEKGMANHFSIHALRNPWAVSQSSCSVRSDSLQPHLLQHTRPPCPSPTPRVYSNSCTLSQWCHPTISSSVIPFSSCLQSFPASGSFQMSQLFASGGQSIGVGFKE